MIDRDARDRIALALRQLGSGRLSLDEYESICDAILPSDDPAITAVEDASYWGSCELGPKRFVGRHLLSPESRRDIARVVVFLRSDFEYRWPSERDWSALRYLLHVLGVRCIPVSQAEIAQWAQVVDAEAWPFVSVAEVKSAASVPVFRSPSRANAG